MTGFIEMTFDVLYFRVSDPQRRYLWMTTKSQKQMFNPLIAFIMLFLSL